MHKRKDTQKAKGTLGLYILKKIGEFGIIAVDGFFPAKYPEARLWRSVLGLDSTYVFSPKNFSAMLSKLKQRGLVERIGSKKRAHWQLTKEGRNIVLESTREPQTDGIKRLVIFDIPESERRKRVWIRTELISMGYEQLQKSVWIGEVPLPQTFIESLTNLKLIGKVHIFSLRDSGTLDA